MIKERNQRGRSARARAPTRKDAAELAEKQAARNLQLYLASIVESSDDAIVGKTLDGIVTSWNMGAERIFGYTASEMCGRPVKLLLPPDRLFEEEDFLARIRRGERVEHYETVRRRKDGTEVEVAVSISPIRNRNGQIVGAAKIARDISGQKLTESRIRELQAELSHAARLSTVGQMAASITHELTQPLTAIANYLFAIRRLLAAPSTDPRLLAEAIEKSLAQTSRAAGVVRGFRDFLIKGRTDQHAEDFNEVVRQVLPLALIGAKPNGIESKLHLDDDVGLVSIDRLKIGQVLLNLVRNAVEAMEHSSRRELTIATSSAADARSVELRVADTGPGLAPEIAARLFQPFVTTKATGMGIGLSICRDIVEAHGGRLWTQPNRPDGTVFCMRLPRGAAEAQE